MCRSAAHCIEYAHLIQWGQERTGEDFDPDVDEHMQWVYRKALVRAEHYGIPVRPLTHTQDVKGSARSTTVYIYMTCMSFMMSCLPVHISLHCASNM